MAQEGFELTAPITEDPASKPAFRDPKPTAERVPQLAQRVLSGDILLPRFQRNFVWNRTQVIELLDSIARNYPIGSMLLWQSRKELANVRNIADLEVATARPEYPVNYLLDGQQRLSTICGALYWRPGDPRSIWNLAYDLRTDKFVFLDTIDSHAVHQVPLRHLSNPSEFFSRTLTMPAELQARAKNLFDRFTDYLIPVVTLGDMSIEDVAPVFERINSTGTRLTIVDLMRAATWTETFDLVDAIDNLLEELEPKKFNEIDRKTVLRAVAASAGLGFSSGSIDDLRNRKEEQLRTDVESTLEAAKRSADFLSTQIGAPNARALPYANQFAVLTEIFRLIPYPTSEQYNAIRHWFWRTTFASYFGGWNTGQMGSDLQAVRDFAGDKSSDIANPSILPRDSIWIVRDFRANSATSKMLALMLAHENPVDLLTGQSIDVGKSLAWNNDKEYHHFFPKGYLAKAGVDPRRSNSIANIVLLTSHSNLMIRDKAPSEYLKDLRERIGEDELRQRLASLLISDAAYEMALRDDYDEFLKARAADLQRRALILVGEPDTSDTGVIPAASSVDDSDADPSE